MENNITPNEMKLMLATLQHYQFEMFGKQNVCIETRIDKDGELWMIFESHLVDKDKNINEFVVNHCYPFWSYERNMEEFNEFVGKISEFLENKEK